MGGVHFLWFYQIASWIKWKDKPTKILRHQNSQNFQSSAVSCASKRKQTTDLAVLKSFKQNVVIGDAHHAKRISYGFDDELSVIKLKHIKAGYPPQICYFCDKYVYCWKRIPINSTTNVRWEKKHCIFSHWFAKLMNKK